MRSKMLLLLVFMSGVAADQDELWTPDHPGTPILKNHPTEQTKVCRYRSEDGSCYRLWLNNPSNPNSHMPIPWSRRENFVTILDKLDRMEEGGYCLLYEGRKWTKWQGQGRASTACGKLRHHTEQSTCLVPANACGGIATCQQNERRTRGGTVRNAACCVVTGWMPEPGTIPVGQIFTRRNNCGGEEQDIGEKLAVNNPEEPAVNNPEEPAVNNPERPAVNTLGCRWFGDYSASSAGPYVEALPGPLPVNCHWQPGELLNRMYVRSRDVGLHPYPWGALTGVCSPFTDKTRHYYENRGGGYKIPGTVELLTYVQVCN